MIICSQLGYTYSKIGRSPYSDSSPRKKQALIRNAKWGDDGKPILATDSMIDTLEDETKEVWIMDPVPKDTEKLSQPEEQQDMEAGQNKGTALVGTPQLDQPLGSFTRTSPYHKRTKFKRKQVTMTSATFLKKTSLLTTPPLLPTRQKPAYSRWKATYNSNTRVCIP